MIKAVLFDMDGTVLDTEPMYKKAWKSAFVRAEYEFSDELFNQCVGLPVSLCKQLINQTYNDPDLFGKTFPMAASFAHNYIHTHKYNRKVVFDMIATTGAKFKDSRSCEIENTC